MTSNRDTDPESAYNEVAEHLEAKDPSVQRGKMFGMPTIKAGGKAIAGLHGDDMVFKLPDEKERERALEIEGAHLFEPMEGRAMKEWVQVPREQFELWKGLAEPALAARA